MTEREQERAAIVAWLRTEPAEFIAYVHEPFGAWCLADAIERGEHERKDHD